MSEESQISLNSLFKKWCKETRRSGGVLVGSSIREFLEYVEKTHKLIKIEEDERINVETN